VQPVVVDSENEVIIGHGRLKAAKKLGLNEIPVIRHDDITDSEAKALRLADNKIAESEWEDEKLAVELEQLTEADDFDELIHGFDEDEMSEYLDSLTDEEDLEEPETEDPEQVETDIQEGEVFKLGEHRLMCGDATNENHIEKLMNGEKADMVFTDPPYGVDVASKNKHLNSETGSSGRMEREIEDDDKAANAEKLIEKSFQTFRDSYNAGTPVYMCATPGPDTAKAVQALIEAGHHIQIGLTWVKNNHALGRMDYQAKHEMIWYGWAEGEGSHSWYGGDSEMTVWEFDRPNKNEYHPTQKPINLPVYAIKNSSKRDDVVVDQFCGSGATLLAAEQTDRKAYCMELDPQYCQVIINRWEDLTGKNAEPVT